MGGMYSTDMLASGLRALGVIARHAPVAIEDLARLSGTTSHEAKALVETFVQQGYAVRFADTASYILTDLALPLVPISYGDSPSLSVH